MWEALVQAALRGVLMWRTPQCRVLSCWSSPWQVTWEAHFHSLQTPRVPWSPAHQVVPCYPWDSYLSERKGALDKKTASPCIKWYLFSTKSACGTSGAGTTLEDCARQRTTTGGVTFIVPMGNGPRSNPFPTIPRLCLRSSWFVPKRRLEWTEILHFSLLGISTPVHSLALFYLAKQKTLSADYIGSCSSCLSTSAYMLKADGTNTHLDVGDWAWCLY